MYSVYLIGSRAVALLGIRRHLGLINGQADEQPLVRPDSRCVHLSVPCIFSVANLGGLGSHCHGLVTIDVEGFLVAQDAPCDPRQFVGQSRCQLVAMHSWDCIEKPCSEAEALPIVRAHQDDVCSLDEQGSEILASSLGDAAQDGSTTSAVLAWQKTKPRAEVSPALECLRLPTHISFNERSSELRPS